MVMISMMKIIRFCCFLCLDRALGVVGQRHLAKDFSWPKSLGRDIGQNCLDLFHNEGVESDNGLI